MAEVNTEKPGLLAWEVTPLGIAVLIVIFYFGAISGLWTLLKRDSFRIYFDGYVRAGDSGARRRYHARFKQAAPLDADTKLLAIVEAPGSTTAERRAATELIGETGDASLFPALQRLSQPGGDPSVRSAAIVAMGGIRSDAARSELSALLRSPDRTARLDAIHAAAVHGRDDLADGIRLRIQEGDTGERLAAVSAAGSVRGMETDLLKVHLSDPVAEIRFAAARSLREIPRTTLTRELPPALLESMWVPVQPDLPRRRVTNIQRQLESSFLLMLEDALAQLQDGDPDLACADDDCRNERNFYHDLLRRRSKVKMTLEGFQRGRKSVYFASGVWSSGNKPRFAILAMVLPADHRDAVFPVRSIPVSGDTAGPVRALGNVLAVTGDLKDESILVDILDPDSSIQGYSFRNGIFVPVSGPPAMEPSAAEPAPAVQPDAGEAQAR